MAYFNHFNPYKTGSRISSLEPNPTNPEAQLTKASIMGLGSGVWVCHDVSSMRLHLGNNSVMTVDGIDVLRSQESIRDDPLPSEKHVRFENPNVEKVSRDERESPTKKPQRSGFSCFSCFSLFGKRSGSSCPKVSMDRSQFSTVFRRPSRIRSLQTSKTYLYIASASAMRTVRAQNTSHHGWPNGT